MDVAGTKFFARLERKQGKQAPTAEDYEAAERAFVERFAPQFDAIEQAAPAEIREDVQILLAGQRQRAGLGGPVDETEAGRAERRVLRHERRAPGPPARAAPLQVRPAVARRASCSRLACGVVR